MIRDKIKDNQTFETSYYGSALEKQDAGTGKINVIEKQNLKFIFTAHISVYGQNGDAVSITSTINNQYILNQFKKSIYFYFSFGAKYAGKYTGILYNDIMDDFSTPGLTNSFGFEPSEANFIKPGKRPLSSMCPIIVVDKENNVRLILGASGGSKIISAVSQVLLHIQLKS